MKRLSPSFAVAFCFSLLLASTALLLLDRQAQTSLGWIQWSAVHGQYARYDQSTGYVRVPMALPHQTAKMPLLAVVPPPEEMPLPVVPPPPPVDEFLEQLGDHEGGGLGINSAPGEKPMESPFADPEHAHEQPMLSRDPQRPGPLTATPAPSQIAPGQNGGGGSGLIKPRPDQEAMKPPQMHDPIPKPATPQPPAPQPVVQATPPVVPQNPAPQPKPASTPVPDKMIAIGPTAPTPTTKPAERKAESEKRKAETKKDAIASTKPADDAGRKPVMAEMPSTQPAIAAKPTPPAAVPPAVVPVTVAMATPSSLAQSDPSAPPPDPANTGTPGTPGTPGTEAAAASPAPQSDQASFPVTQHPYLVLTGSQMKAQIGRNHKFREMPHIDVAGQDHIHMSMGDLKVQMELRTDADGNVTRVRMVTSSGCEAIDMPCQRAAYTWWFEPPVDKKTKKPQADVILFSIVFL